MEVGLVGPHGLITRLITYMICISDWSQLMMHDYNRLEDENGSKIKTKGVFPVTTSNTFVSFERDLSMNTDS